MRRILTLAVALAATVAVDAQQQGRPVTELQRPRRVDYGKRADIEVIKVKGDVYLLAGAGTHVVVQVGPQALFVVDTATADMSDKLLAAIKTISPLPIRFVVNTSADADHVGGNERFAKSAGDNVNAFLQQSARVYATEAAYARMTNPKDGSAPQPTAIWPTDSFSSPLKSLYNGEPIELIRRPNAHTDGDLMVFFRTSDVLVTGELFATDRYPVIDAKHGGTLDGIIGALNQAIDIAIPEYNSMGGTMVIPASGPIANEIDLVEYRDGLSIIGDRVTQRVLEGRTLDQVKAEGVSLDYDGIYGATSGPWTTDMFIAAVYNEVKANTQTWRARLLRNVPVDELPFLSTNARPGAARPAARAAAAPARTNLDPLEGKWIMDVFTSKYEPAGLSPYRREMTVSFAGDEITHASSTWRRQGNASPLSTSTYKAKLDGREYAIPQTSSKVTLKRIDASSIERSVAGTDGSKETATWTLSADRKKLTIVAKGTDPTGVNYSSTQIFDKQ